MSTKDIELSKKITRFIVPFAYDADEKGFYEKLEKVMADKADKMWLPTDFSRKECDLYDFVRDGVEIASDRAICHGYVINSNCKKKILPNINVQLKRMQEQYESIAVKITDVGLYLFEGGVGFLWYQLDAAVQSGLVLAQLNNGLKEFTHHSGAFQCFQTEVLHLNTGIAVTNCKSVQTESELPTDAVVIGGKKKAIKYFLPSQLPSNWSEDYKYEYYEREGSIWARYTLQKEFRFADWIVQLLEPVKATGFFASREESTKQGKCAVPDKAILFSCILTKQEEERKIMLSHLFWIAKGYTSRYMLSERYVQEENDYYFRPFENVTWFASEEGCAQLVNVSDNSENKEFFEETYWNRQDIYFYIYMLVLQQYYGLLKINTKLAKLPLNLKGFSKRKSRTQLRECKEEINFFFTNAIHLKISHIAHQNALFTYMSDKYGLAEMTDKLKEKIEVLNDMVETWYQDIKNKRLVAISIIGSVFAFIQTLNNVLGIYDYLPWQDFMNIGEFTVLTFGVAVLVSVVAAFVLNVFGDD